MAQSKEPFDQNKYIQKYMKNTYWRMTLLLNRRTDADIIDYLESKKNKNGYLRELIRKDIEK